MPQARFGKSKAACEPCAEGDEIGAYTYERLLEMDARFCERLERAIALGLESAAGMLACPHGRENRARSSRLDLRPPA